jgi:hypothetical protein
MDNAQNCDSYIFGVSFVTFILISVLQVTLLVLKGVWDISYTYTTVGRG